MDPVTTAVIFPGTEKVGGYIPEGTITVFRYPQGGALGIGTGDFGTPDFSVLSVNPHSPLFDGEVAIKDYSANEGVLKTLLDAGLVTRPHRSIPSGHVVLPVCRLAGALAEVPV